MADIVDNVNVFKPDRFVLRLQQPGTDDGPELPIRVRVELSC